MGEFVEGWNIIQTLGEGSYGEVKLLMNSTTEAGVAMKIIDLEKHPNAKAEVKKEIIIHSQLSNENIIKYYGQRQDDHFVYIFLEYAPCGELFDKIEPDVGMPYAEAQKYFLQLLSGVKYLHDKGIAHRDLKPENLLLTASMNLKISDFGMATVFKMNGRERVLDRKCGTLPYCAPEVLVKSYHAQPADLWSCGIILVALLAGELPWDSPATCCKEYVAWAENNYANSSPWTKIETTALSLIRKVLVPVPSYRYTIDQILNHRWCVAQHSPSETSDCRHIGSFNGSSQPIVTHMQDIPDYVWFNKTCFSQPTQIDNLLLSSQLLLTSQSATQSFTNVPQRLVHRMTRFFVSYNFEEALKNLLAALEALNYTWKLHNGMITISTVDSRKSPLTFKSNVLIMDGHTLLDFRLSRGCGLEFKRCFLRIKEQLRDGIVKFPVKWAEQ